MQGLHSVVDALLQVSSCKTLMLEDIEVDEEQAIHSLKKLLDDKKCKRSVLELNSLNMSENTSLQLITSLKNLKHLKQLSLKKNNLTGSFIETLAVEIQSLRTLTILNLSHCEITDDIFQKFSEGL